MHPNQSEETQFPCFAVPHTPQRHLWAPAGTETRPPKFVLNSTPYPAHRRADHSSVQLISLGHWRIPCCILAHETVSHNFSHKFPTRSTYILLRYNFCQRSDSNAFVWLWQHLWQRPMTHLLDHIFQYLMPNPLSADLHQLLVLEMKKKIIQMIEQNGYN